MRPRTFLLLILVLIFGAIAVVLIIANSSGNDLLSSLTGNGNGDTTVDDGTVTDGDDSQGAQEPGIPTPEPTPVLRLETVVIAKTDIPVGTMLTSDLLDEELRPTNNVALQGGYIFNDIAELEGEIVRVDIARGEAILRPMIAINSSDLSSFGSDIALYIDRGNVAVAFPIDRYSGVAFAARPGDRVDLMMSSRVIEIDPDFRTALPNFTQRVIESELLDGRFFLFPETTQGRLEFVPEINQVVEIVPSTISLSGQEVEAGDAIPKRVTQLTIQQAEVMFVGTWQNRRELEREQAEALGAALADPEAPRATPTPLPQRFDDIDVLDVIILSMPAQDALALKWALERGVDIDLALRAQGDETLFVTTSVSLFQIVEQGGVIVPPPSDFDLSPRPEAIDPPNIPPLPLVQEEE